MDSDVKPRATGTSSNPAGTTDALRRLRLFNEKAQELRSYSFIEKAFNEDAGVTINFDFERQTLKATRTGADNEARAAMCLVLRFFLQPKDKIELHQIANLYQELPIDDQDKHWVSENLKDLDTFLDETGNPSLALDNTPITHRTILETFLYGDQAHTNEDKRTVYLAWKEVPAVHAYLESTFEYTVGRTIRYIFWLARLNEETIKTLEGIQPSMTSS